jgi:hypothetical protein
MKSDYQFKRCAICDYTDMDTSVKARDFVLDQATQDYHCMECAKEIQSTIMDDEWENYDWTKPALSYWKRGQKHGALKGARNGAEAARKKPVPTLPEYLIGPVDPLWDDLTGIPEEDLEFEHE